MDRRQNHFPLKARSLYMFMLYIQGLSSPYCLTLQIGTVCYGTSHSRAGLKQSSIRNSHRLASPDVVTLVLVFYWQLALCFRAVKNEGTEE